MQRRSMIFGALGAATAGFAGSASAATNWDFYIIVGVGHPMTNLFQQFADDVKRRTSGDLVITVRPAGELPFKATEMVRITGEGQVQLGEALGQFMSGTLPLAGVMALPMLVRTPEDMQKALPIMNRHIAKDLEKAGTRVLFPMAWPIPHFYGSGKPIRTPEDFAGRKLRVLSAQGAEMLKLLGGTSVSLTTAEVPVGLERGTIEGVVTTALTMVGSKWADMAKWGYECGVQGSDDYVIMNLAAYRGLSQATRSALDAAAAEWGPKISQANLKLEAEARQQMLTKFKMELVTPAPADVERMMAKMKPYWQSWANATGPQAVAVLQEIRQVLGR